jgi:phosphatidylglycerophosphatase C
VSEAVTIRGKQSDATARVVLFDFDGVLIRGDSYAHFVRRELTRSRLRLALMVPVIAVVMPMLKARALRARGQRLIVHCAFLGWSAGGFEAHARQFGRHLAGDTRLVVRDAVETMRGHVAEGARVVVASQSADAVVRAVLDEWG